MQIEELQTKVSDLCVAFNTNLAEVRQCMPTLITLQRHFLFTFKQFTNQEQHECTRTCGRSAVMFKLTLCVASCLCAVNYECARALS